MAGAANTPPAMRSLCTCCLLLLPLSCGRPVTESECQEIVGRIAELELEATRTVSGAELKAEVEATKKAFEDEAMRDCVGKRVTEDALACVRSATSAKQIVQECFD